MCFYVLDELIPKCYFCRLQIQDQDPFECDPYKPKWEYDFVRYSPK